jgi:hypothetical protein
VKSCPKCKLASPDEAVRCDCGYDFETRKIEKSYLVPPNGLSSEQLSEAKSKGNRWLGACLLILLLHTVCLFYTMGGGHAPILGFLLSLIFVLFCCQYALCKGYSWLWGLWGLLSFLGLALLVSKPYKARNT